jgi:hypothetical protein
MGLATTVGVAAGLCACSSGGGSEQADAGSAPGSSAAPAELTRKPLDEYSWQELAEISRKIEAAGGGDASAQVARDFGILADDGSLAQQTKRLDMTNGLSINTRVAGVMHDQKADGSGPCGLTLMTVGGVDLLPMNEAATSEGGWEASTLRAWLAQDGKALLPDDLAGLVVPVQKMTNNTGETRTTDSVTATTDELWCFSAREVCGELDWYAKEYNGTFASDMDRILNAEGDQYQWFAEAGVTPHGGEAALSLEESTGRTAWWYRSPFPFDWTQTNMDDYFYQVKDTGYPESLAAPESKAAVVFGFCV